MRIGSTWQGFLAITGALSVAASFPPNAEALRSPVAFSSYVGQSGVIAAGTVVSSAVRRIDGVIVTEVTLRNLVFVKDTRSAPTGDSLVIWLCGGRLAGEILACEDVETNFEVGGRYILLLDKSLGKYHQGGYDPVRDRVREHADSASGEPYVLFHSSGPEFHATELDRNPYAAAMAPRPDYPIRVSERDFLAAIQEIMARDSKLPQKHKAE
jgi:hypothetical protein